MTMPAKRKPLPETDGEVFTAIGQALFPDNENWPSQFGAALNLSKQTVRNIRREAVDLHPETAATMLAMIERRATETVRARDALKAWIKKRS